ncbi:hypothetical protein [Acetobacter oeni]|uniref:Uncharacterized protein n=1 Tax=Acetobacter oeni TaxID=304077 RepID=A0A511XJQ7_9PROT|nr:hypothetical protein [Acetobacter oeni]MBB3883402.1 hypothetical protein [Acetobacter oeni]NHO19377.1 hypothetical protein [Acetobacter oeni]GBR03945.1 hypothetical protein AA21952_1236 [Acetobacter oeni LMG 21952]GEN63183.1 hypothetical protein AOE01nite_14070 [Acetobacter oeni]
MTKILVTLPLYSPARAGGKYQHFFAGRWIDVPYRVYLDLPSEETRLFEDAHPALVRQDDALAALAEKDAEIERLRTLLKPTWWGEFGDENSSSDLDTLLDDHCEFEIVQVEGYATVERKFAFSGAGTVHTFDTCEEAAEAARKQLETASNAEKRP